MQRGCIYVVLYKTPFCAESVARSQHSHWRGPEKLSMHTCDWELSDHATAVTANHGGHVTRMPAFRHLEDLTGSGGGGGKGVNKNTIIGGNQKPPDAYLQIGSLLIT